MGSIVASAVSLFVLVGRSGCAFTPLTGFDDVDGEVDAVPPVLSELADAGIQVACAEELATCVKASGLAEEVMRPADPTNFGTRENVDDWGRILKASPALIVLHETVISESAAVNLFQTPHPRNEDQVS